jgi:hypothetical protein
MHRLRFVLLLEGHAARDAATGTSPTPNRSGFEVAFCDLNLGWSCYQPMKDLFSEVIEISIGRASA